MCVWQTVSGVSLPRGFCKHWAVCVGVVIARAAIRDRLDMQASAQAFASMMISDDHRANYCADFRRVGTEFQ